MRYILGVIFLLCFDVRAEDELVTVPYVNLDQYVGTWYQIARNPIVFEDGCVCSRQVLTPTPEGRVSVFNSCNDMSIDGPLRTIRGFATIDDPSSNSKLTVDFNLPRKGAYWIIGLDSQYRYAVVSDPSRYALYVLSKTPTLEPDLYNEAVQTAALQIDVSQLSLTTQTGCHYPEGEKVQ